MITDAPIEKKKSEEHDSRVGHETVFVDRFTNGILDPNQPMLGPVRDGGHIVAKTATQEADVILVAHVKSAFGAIYPQGEIVQMARRHPA